MNAFTSSDTSFARVLMESKALLFAKTEVLSYSTIIYFVSEPKKWNNPNLTSKQEYGVASQADADDGLAHVLLHIVQMPPQGVSRAVVIH